jgi:hypothetical protein
LAINDLALASNHLEDSAAPLDHVTLERRNVMKIEWNTETPRKIQQFANPDYPTENPDLEDVLTSQDVNHVAQIFKTPLTGSYN